MSNLHLHGFLTDSDDWDEGLCCRNFRQRAVFIVILGREAVHFIC